MQFLDYAPVFFPFSPDWSTGIALCSCVHKIVEMTADRFCIIPASMVVEAVGRQGLEEGQICQMTLGTMVEGTPAGSRRHLIHPDDPLNLDACMTPVVACIS